MGRRGIVWGYRAVQQVHAISSNEPQLQLHEIACAYPIYMRMTCSNMWDAEQTRDQIRLSFFPFSSSCSFRYILLAVTATRTMERDIRSVCAQREEEEENEESELRGRRLCEEFSDIYRIWQPIWCHRRFFTAATAAVAAVKTKYEQRK